MGKIQTDSHTNSTVKTSKQIIIEQLTQLVVLAVVGIACLYIGKYLERERPRLEIAKIQLSGSRPPEYLIHPPPAIRTAVDKLFFRYDELMNYSVSIEKWIYVYDRLNVRLWTLTFCPPIIDQMLDILRSTSSAYPEDDLRKELLSIYSKVPGNLLKTIMRSTLYTEDYYRKLTEKWPKYNEHPPRWKTTSEGYVQVSPVRAVDLSEIQIFAEDKSQIAIAKKMDNINRRLWIYLDREVLRQVLAKVAKRIEQIEQETADFLELMDQERELIDPKRVEVKVLMSNSGGRPVIFDSIGMLKLEVGDRIIPIEVHGYINNKLDPKGFFSVNSYGVSVATFFSKNTLMDIESEYFPESTGEKFEVETQKNQKIETLYRTSILKATLSLPRIVPGPEPEIMTTTRKAVFGQEPEDLFSELEK